MRCYVGKIDFNMDLHWSDENIFSVYMPDPENKNHAIRRDMAAGDIIEIGQSGIIGASVYKEIAAPAKPANITSADPIDQKGGDDGK